MSSIAAPRPGAVPARPAARPLQFRQADAGGGAPHYLLLLYLFFFCSRLPEFLPGLRVSALLGFALLAIVAATMRLADIKRMPGGKQLLLFTLWIAVCVPGSYWMGGSVDYLKSSFQALMMVVLMAALIRTPADCYRAMFTVGLAMACAASLSFVFGGTVESDRLVVGHGTLSDPNYYCLYLLTGLPFLWLGATQGGKLKRILSLGLMLPVLYAAAATGSRGGMVAFAAGMVFFFLMASARQKIVLALGSAMLLIAATAILPERLTKRFTTFMEAQDGGKNVAVESANARKHLLIRSIVVTGEHPIFGVGPGMFMVAENEFAREQGERKGAWHVTHNTYTQFSSELGIPGAILFLAVLWAIYRGLTPIRKRAATPDARRAAMLLQVCAVMMCVSALFLSLGYGGLLYVLIGLSGTFQAAIARETAMARTAPLPAPAPAPRPRAAARPSGL